MSDESQPTGLSIEKTMHVVYHVLTDPEFAAEVLATNGFPEDLDQTQTAILFLACRYQEAVELLTMRTNTLKRELDGVVPTVRGFEDRMSGGDQ